MRSFNGDFNDSLKDTDKFYCPQFLSMKMHQGQSNYGQVLFQHLIAAEENKMF